MDFTIDGNPVWFYGITGTVQGLQNWSSSDVSTSGIGSSADPVRITSATQQHTNFWIVTDKGREVEIDNPNFRCREGHKVTLIWGADKGKAKGAHVLFLNHNTNEIFPIKDSDKYSQFKKIGCFYLEIMNTGIQLCMTIILSPAGIPIFIFGLIMWVIKSQSIPKYDNFIKSLLQNKEFMQSISQ